MKCQNVSYRLAAAVLICAALSVAAVCSVSAAQCCAARCCAARCCAAGWGPQWKIHDLSRPQPPTVDPGQPGQPPSDAIVLFDGTDLSEWVGRDGGPAKWKVKDGYMEAVGETGDITSERGFGDCQLHIEWMTAVQAPGKGQHKSNSGVFLMGLYEVQVLDCYGNKSYPDGLAGSIYGQYPPLVNASRPQGEWQSYDIIFRRPRFGIGGQLIRPARTTVLHNGVLVQDNTTLMGPTAWMDRPPYEAHPSKLPLKLQDHGDPVRFRNIWIRELPEGGPCAAPFEGVAVAPGFVDRYVGRYERPSDDFTVKVAKEGDGLTAQVNRQPVRKLIPLSDRTFAFDKVGVELEFHVTPGGVVEGLTFHLGGEQREANKVK